MGSALGNDQELVPNQNGEFENYPTDDIQSAWNIDSDNLNQISLSGNGFLGFFHEAG